MAKAKKSAEAADTAKDETKPAAKKATGAKTASKAPAGAKKPAATTKKPAAAKPAAPAPAGVPMIDTSAAAQAAAAMLRNRNVVASSAGSTPPATGGEKKESASFKQLKQGLTKPAGPGGLLQNPNQQKKFNQPPGGPNQTGRGQTFGADVNRAFVPRRTGGG